MDAIRSQIQAHRTRSCILLFGLAVLMNCFGFPVYNLGRDWSLMLVAEYLYISVFSSIFIGGGLAGIFPKSRFLFILFLIAALTCAGMGCRFLLELGEVSNTYNFTAPNIALHLGTVLALTSLSYLYAGKHRSSQR